MYVFVITLICFGAMSILDYFHGEVDIQFFFEWAGLLILAHALAPPPILALGVTIVAGLVGFVLLYAGAWAEGDAFAFLLLGYAFPNWVFLLNLLIIAVVLANVVLVARFLLRGELRLSTALFPYLFVGWLAAFLL